MKLRAELWLPQPPETVFPFFADALNLEQITPPWLRFSIVRNGPIAMQRGTRIDYRLRLRSIPFRWQSEITRWEPPFCFRDEQRRGPYRHWSHTHVFSPQGAGTLCTDEVDYEVRGGRWIHRLFVRHELARIFSYRQRALARHFTGREFSIPGAGSAESWSVALFESLPRAA